jgi:hypothetical protein
MAYEDDDLIELDVVEQFDELLDLLGVLELDVVLLETMEGQLGVTIDEKFERLLHEESADVLGFIVHSG